MTRDEMIEKLAEIERNADHARYCGGWRGPENEEWFEGPCDCWKSKVVALIAAALRAPAVTGEADLSPEQQRKLADALDNPPEPNDALRKLLAAPPADAGAPPALVALVQEWQEARKPATLSAPGEFLAETFQAAVRRMSAADEALAAYQLDGPAGGALVGQTAPTESTGPYLCACTCGCGDRTIRPGRCMVCRVRESCLKNEWTCEACAAGYRLAADGMHYDHDDSTWGVCRKVVASFRREEP